MHIKKLSVAVILGLAALSATPTPARAAARVWLGSGTEFWNFGGNWQLLTQPTAADVAIFKDSVDFTVIRSAVKLSQNTTIAGWEVLGDHPFTGAYSFNRINSAVLTVTGPTILGFAATPPSTVTLDGFLLNTNTLSLSGRMNGVVTGNANINTGQLFLTDRSVLNVNSSANITTTGALDLRDSGTLSLNGGSLNLAANVQHKINTGTMNVNGGALNLGANASLVLFSSISELRFNSGYNILNNAQISVQGGGDVVGTSFIDVGNGGAGFLTVNSTGSTFTAQSSTSDWGRGSTGNATVNILSGGAATVAALRVGTVDAVTNLNVFGGSLTVNSTLEAGGGTASRTVQLTVQDSGTMTLNGTSTFNNQADLNLISGTLNINQNATVNAGSRIDRTGGTLSIASGKKLIINDGVYADTTTGGQILSSGAGIEVRGTFARFNVSQYFDIGNGSLLVESNGQYNSPANAVTTDWAQQTGTVMTATVRNSGRINMGALRIAGGGGATVNVENSGRIEATSLNVGGAGTSNAVLNLNGGFVTVFGSANLGAGTQMTLNDPAGSNTALGQVTQFLVDGTLNLTGNAVIFTQGDNPNLVVDGLNMTGSSRIVMQPGAELFINYGSAAAPLSTIRGYILNGFNNGAWNGVAGISSTAAQTDTRLGIGYRDFPDPQFGSMTIKVTLLGDATLDGTVNFDDLLVLAANYNGTGKHWFQGDSTYDGAVNFDDLLKLASNYNQTLTGSLGGDWALAQSLVPEPALLGSAIPACAGLLTRRRRRAAQ